MHAVYTTAVDLSITYAILNNAIVRRLADARWAKTDVLILDDWGLAPLGSQEPQDLLL